MLTYQKYFVLFLACVLPCAGFSQGLVKGAQAVARKSAQNAPRVPKYWRRWIMAALRPWPAAEKKK